MKAGRTITFVLDGVAYFGMSYDRFQQLTGIDLRTEQAFSLMFNLAYFNGWDLTLNDSRSYISIRSAGPKGSLCHVSDEVGKDSFVAFIQPLEELLCRTT